ncbi:hypothetical protein FBEOM_2391 [Fusarium beomiforme]|uniref:Uncharacterized protein n=1 Tax=Fusarium beomiforme TaxID=44412 RepID=A0A9P5AS37_9HYPO|nr:hypothetical protein FBEOM_2391 [Fusarium beomiforme]
MMDLFGTTEIATRYTLMLYGISISDEGVDPLTSSQSSQSSQNSIPEAAQNNTRPIPYGDIHSQDELADNTGFETDEYRERNPDAPPPSSMNTNNASQQFEQDNQNRHQSRPRQARDSIEYGQRSPSPVFQPPRSASPRPKPNIYLTFSYDALPGLNIRLTYGEELFSFPREQVFRELGWQHDFEWLLITLEAPGVLFPERVPKADSTGFRMVMARFEQIVDAMKRDYAELERDVVIEIAFVPECKGHSRTVLVDAWQKRLDKSQGVVF